MEENKVNYSDLLSLGFERIELKDKVHLSQYGYPYFILSYGNSDDILCMEWSPVSCEVNLYIKSRTYRTGISLEEVKHIVKLLESEM